MIAKVRARRIASDEAHAWARNLRLSNPYAKLVLCMLAGYVNGDGICFVGIEALAEDTELSPDTVRKRLAWLEEVGGIARFPQWVDASGRRNGDGKGKRTTDEIRLLLSADADAIERRAAGDVSESAETIEGSDHGSETSVSPRPQQGLNQPQGSVGPAPALGQPSDSRKGPDSSEPEHEPEESPHSPPSGGVGPDDLSDGEASEAWPHLETWKRFETAFVEPILHQRQCRQLWSALNETEREQAITVAAGYVAWRIGQRKPPNVINAVRLLRERDAWSGFAARAPKLREAEQPKQRNRIPLDTPEFIAVQLACTIAGISRPQPSGDPPAIDFVGEIPHGAHAMAMLAHEPAQWVVRKKDTREFTAWCERIKEWTGHWLEPKQLWLDKDGRVVAREHAYVPPERAQWGVANSVFGLLVPHTPTGFPPPKSGDPPREENESAA
jgi:hypothetical protein